MNKEQKLDKLLNEMKKRKQEYRFLFETYVFGLIEGIIVGSDDKSSDDILNDLKLVIDAYHIIEAELNPVPPEELN
ncbi:hypothetical protein B7C51_15885 [Paenibacillus larvae subsp. pulvifaciens]|uniref:Uncharacterized protein n=1 Tax=Paenibacillus larvae subsp. pulvifaciens TaxID=1477 RepID=A0A1V0UVJ6_9BACL|nr:hypothetical protein [Paenibacillus larvae]ARF68970.1 hypothetical protein B7C51_15885 [Paenibacillus larvae subsp. pulvifaciens]